jgi:Bifunctional DNA primase/polymerase, N-terminal
MPPECDPRPPPQVAPKRIEEQPSLPLNRIAPVGIEARNLGVALDLVVAGFAVFAVRVYWKDGRWKKKPIGSGWQTGTRDPERVRALWRAHPNAVPGIPLGLPSLVVIDADKHGGPDGVAAFDELVAEQGALPPGPVTGTASGGRHFIFKQPPDGRRLGNSEGKLAGRGINVRGGHSGWIVAPGAVCPDGSMWRGSDGSPSLIEAYRNGTIPTIPKWIVDMIRSPPDKSKKAPKAKDDAKEAKPSPSATPPASDKSVTKRERAYASGAIKKIVEELGDMPPDSGRNEKTYRKAFAMGTMIARGWIDRGTVEREMFSACEKNGLVAEGDDVRGAIERGLGDGFIHPHEGLPDRRTKAARQPRDSTRAWKNLLPTEIYHLQRVRPNGQHASLEAAKDVISAIEREGHVIDKLDGSALGRLLHVATEEWKAIGVMFGRHPSRFRPYDSTPEQIDEYLASVREAKKPARALAARERRAREKLERQQPPINDLMARRCKAMVAYAKRYPGKQRTGDLVSGLKRWDAFKDITEKTLRNAVDELLRLAVAGKLPALTKALIVTEGPAKNRRLTFTVEYQNDTRSNTTHCPKIA